MILSYLTYLVTAKRISKFNSSVLQALNRDVFSKINTVKDSSILELISQLKQNKTKLKITDLGAGSKQTNSNIRSVSSIAENASIPPKFGKLLNQLIRTNKYENCIELGTSLGVGTSYLALGNDQIQVYTIEGCPNISELAQTHLKSVNINNVKYFVGEFSSQFSAVLSHFNQPDLVYIDGNHTYNATVEYFYFFKSKLSKKGILVFDDIHWSKGMEKAWTQIIKDESVTLSIDLFRMGIVFIDPNLNKQHVVIKF